MLHLPLYMDNHATTRVDPRVVEAMLPYFSQVYGNPGSVNHPFGWDAKEAVDHARESIARGIGARAKEIVFTSGATESNNLAIRGVAERQRRKGSHLVSVTTEHKAVLDPLDRLSRRGYEVTLLEVAPADNSFVVPPSDGNRGSDAESLFPPEGGTTNLEPGWLDPNRVVNVLRDDTILVSIMLANNEIGIIQPLAEIARMCRERGIVLHCDATQAVGKIPVDVQALGVDLMSFSAHKVYGPKGIGALYVRRGEGGVRLQAQIDGGGQEGGLRSGTLNVPGIVGFAKALELCLAEMPQESQRLAGLRERLYRGFVGQIDDVSLNGPSLDVPGLRLPGNLNVSFAYVDGEALMMSMKDLAVSSGSACTSANPEPSHVLRALGLSDDLTRASLRFGLGRFNTDEEVDFAIAAVADAVKRLRRMSSMA